MNLAIGNQFKYPKPVDETLTIFSFKKKKYKIHMKQPNVQYPPLRMNGERIGVTLLHSNQIFSASDIFVHLGAFLSAIVWILN